MNELLRKFQTRAGTLAGWFQQACGLAVAAVTLPFILDPEILTTAQAGFWLSCQIVLNFIYLSDFGISFALARQTAYTMTEDRRAMRGTRHDFIETASGWDGLAALHEMTHRLFLCMALIAAVLLIAVYEFIFPLGKLLNDAGNGTRIAWYLLGASALIGLQTRLAIALLDGTGRVYLTRFLSGLGQLLTGGLILAVLQFQPSLANLSCAVLVGGLAQLAAVSFTLRRAAPNRLQSPARSSRIPIRVFWKACWPVGVMVVAAFFTSQVQVPLIGALLGPAMVPPFYVAQKLLHTLGQSLQHIIFPQLPPFTDEYASDRRHEARRRIQRSLAFLISISVCGLLAFQFGSTWLVKVWLQKAAYVDTRTLTLLTLDAFLLNVGVACSWFVMATGVTPFTRSTCAAAILNVFGIVMLVPSLGLFGAALAGLLAGILTQHSYAILLASRLFRRLGRLDSSE